MGVMSSLRDKTHIILYTLLAAFLALIVFEWGMNFTGFVGGNGQIASVNGETVPYERYNKLYEQISQDYQRSNPSADLTPEAEQAIRQRAWDTMIDQLLLEQQFKAFGISVEDAEVVEAIERPNPPSIIARYFTNPETGVLDRGRLDSARVDPANRDIWHQVEGIIRQELKIEKLVRALRTMPQVTRHELDELVRREYTRFNASFIPMTYAAAGPDSAFVPTPDDIEAYYQGHRDRFRQESVRSADFVFFPLVPSSKDSLVTRNDLEAIRQEFASTRNDTDFVRIQSDDPNAVGVPFTRADFSPEAGELIFNSADLKAGGMIGPVADNGEYLLIKVSKLIKASQPVARASHILIPADPDDAESLAAARQTASVILRELNEGASFAELARRSSADPGSARLGGDLGWFSAERMVPEFSDAVFGARKGSIVGPVQTRFGLHIIKVTGLDSRAFTGSEISRIIRPSTQTTESIKRRATAFEMAAGEEGFDAAVAADTLQVGTTGEFGPSMPIRGIGFSDAASAFAFKASEGDVSNLIETPQGFFVLRITGKNDSGYRKLDGQLKAAITRELVREKKGDALRARLAGLAGAPGATLDKIAAVSPDLRLVKATDIRWSDGFIPGYGVDRILVEAISGMAEGKLSGPVQTMDGYALVLVDGKALPEGLDLKTEAAGIAPQFMNLKQERFFEEYFASLRKTAKIEDFRQ